MKLLKYGLVIKLCILFNYIDNNINSYKVKSSNQISNSNANSNTLDTILNTDSKLITSLNEGIGFNSRYQTNMNYGLNLEENLENQLEINMENQATISSEDLLESIIDTPDDSQDVYKTIETKTISSKPQKSQKEIIMERLKKLRIEEVNKIKEYNLINFDIPKDVDRYFLERLG